VAAGRLVELSAAGDQRQPLRSVAEDKPVRDVLAVPKERVGAHGESAALRRAGQPVIPAPAFVFFASQESGCITAEVLGVTGGYPLH
jgi:hypothetical protein